jgi:hypothetical protein
LLGAIALFRGHDRVVLLLDLLDIDRRLRELHVQRLEVRIPAHRDHRFRSNVTADSGGT